MDELDCSSLTDAEIESVKRAIARGEKCITAHIPDKALEFVLRNYGLLSKLGVLELSWMQAYVHASHFNHIPLASLQKVFDACNRQILQEHYPIPGRGRFSSGERFSLFRGCAGPDHRMGMSWLHSLDKAIWYAAHHVAYYELANPAVYAAVVARDEIYCCADHYDIDYIVCPKAWWRVDVPISEFRLDRPR